MQPSSWIERGPDGRPYYVKRRPAFPSFRQIFAEAFRDLRQRHQPVIDGPGKAPASPEQPPAPAPTPASRASSTNARPKSSLKHKPQARPDMAERSNTPAQANRALSERPGQAQQPHSYPAYPTFPPFMQPTGGHDNISGAIQAQQNGALVQHYATPHPRMYPYVPPGNHALNMPQNGGPPTSYTPMPFGPGQNMSQQQQQTTPAGYTQQNLTLGAMPLNPADPKHKCGTCGRFRSSRYQRKHPIPPGQLPGLTICRKCREKESDSDDDSSDSYEDKDYRSLSRSRQRSQSRGRASRPRSRARSSNRYGRKNVEFDYYAARDQEFSSSDSDLSEPRVPRRYQSRSRRTREPSIAVTRYADGPLIQPHPQRRTKKVVYVEDPRGQDYETDEEEVEVRYVQSYPRLVLANILLACLANLLDRLWLSAGLVRQHEECYLDSIQIPSSMNAAWSNVEPITTTHRCLVRSTTPRLPLTTISTIAGATYEVHLGADRNMYRIHLRQESANNITSQPLIIGHEAGFTPMVAAAEVAVAIPLTKVCFRSRMLTFGTLLLTLDEGAESGALPPHMPPVPMPPTRMRLSSSSGHADASAEDNVDIHDKRARSSSRRKRALAVGDGTHTYDGDPADDYDWYDSNGMKVRVREI